MVEVLHGDVDGIGGFIPTKTLNEAMSVLQGRKQVSCQNEIETIKDNKVKEYPGKVEFNSGFQLAVVAYWL